MKLLSIRNYFNLTLLFLCLFFAGAATVSARTLEAGKLRIEYAGEGALFNETNIAPGFEVVKTVTVTNTGNVPHSFSIAVSGQLGKLAEVLQIEPRNFETGAPIWNKTINNIAKAPDSNVIFGSIAPGQTRQVNIAAILPLSVGNEYQDTSTFLFDFVVGNESTDPSELVSQSLNISSFISANPRIPSALRGNSSTSGSIVSSDDTGVVAGANNNSSSVNNQGEVGGVSTESKNICPWWWILLIVLAALLTLYGILFRRRKSWFFLFWPVFFGAVIYDIHLILQGYYQPSKWCGWWFIGIVLFEIVLYYILTARRTNSKQS